MVELTPEEVAYMEAQLEQIFEPDIEPDPFYKVETGADPGVGRHVTLKIGRMYWFAGHKVLSVGFDVGDRLWTLQFYGVPYR